MKKLKNRIFSRYGDLLVLSDHLFRKEERFCIAVCSCGVIREYNLNSLVRGRTRSCGCSKNVKHGLHKKGVHPLTSTWQGMRQRCNNPNNKDFPSYGAKGIKVCKRWESFEKFVEDMGDKPTKYSSLDRINTDGDYEPTNCRWASKQEQVVNRKSITKLDWDKVEEIRKRIIKGDSISQLSRDFKVSRTVIRGIKDNKRWIV